MSVLVRGMEMPRYCDECKLLYDCASCMVLEKAIDWETSHERRRDDCPLVEVKAPHGRMIDADALMESFVPHEFSSDMGDAMEILENWHTILEAEGKDDG